MQPALAALVGAGTQQAWQPSPLLNFWPSGSTAIGYRLDLRLHKRPLSPAAQEWEAFNDYHAGRSTNDHEAGPSTNDHEAGPSNSDHEAGPSSGERSRRKNAAGAGAAAAGRRFQEARQQRAERDERRAAGLPATDPANEGQESGSDSDEILDLLPEVRVPR